MTIQMDDEAIREPLLAYDASILTIPNANVGESLLGILTVVTEKFDAEFVIDEDFAEILLKALQGFLEGGD
jgi:hypothetical protein